MLSVWDGEAPVVVRVDDNPDRLVRISIHTGSRLTPFRSSQGRVFCAFLPEGEVNGLRRALKKDSKLAAELQKVKRQRLAIASDVEPGIRAIAAPVFQGERCMATVAIVGTAASVSEAPTSRMAKQLLVTAGALSREFGTVFEPARELVRLRPA